MKIQENCSLDLILLIILYVISRTPHVVVSEHVGNPLAVIVLPNHFMYDHCPISNGQKWGVFLPFLDTPKSLLPVFFQMFR